MTKKIKIEDRNLIDKLQMLSVEVNSRKELLAFMIQNNSYIMAKDAFDKYHKEYQELFAEYDRTKNELQNTYIFPEHQGTVDWSLDFASGELTLNY